MNSIQKLAELGQAAWLDSIHRRMLASDDLDQLIEAGLCGMTTNPKIFHEAIADGDDYDDQVFELAQQGWDAKRIFEAIAVQDVQQAAAAFRPVYEDSNHVHGFVSLEVNPHLARDTHATIDEARRLWQLLDRPNVFIKVPGTREGLPAIETLISEGINVNVTLLLGLSRYREVADAYLTGIETRAQHGEKVDDVHSVASFFLSRIDVLVDEELEAIGQRAGSEQAPRARQLHGQVAIASAKLAYQSWKRLYEHDRWQPLAEQKARPQRLLWASTSTKNPGYSDVKYVDALVGPQTINTMPRATLDAYLDHGSPIARLETGLDGARRAIDDLATMGIGLDRVAGQLIEAGIDKFIRPFDQLLEAIDEKSMSLSDKR